jgi:hypothetical protein
MRAQMCVRRQEAEAGGAVGAGGAMGAGQAEAQRCGDIALEAFEPKPPGPSQSHTPGLLVKSHRPLP